MRKLLNKNTARLTLVFILLLSLFMGWKATQIGFSYDFEAFFPKKDKEVAFYQSFKKHFTSNDRLTVLSFSRKSGVINSEGLKALKGVTDSIRKLDHVQNVASILDAQSAIYTQMGLMSFPVIEINESGDYFDDSLRIWNSPLLNGYLIDSSFQTAIVQVTTPIELGKASTDSLANHFEQIKDYYGFDDINIGGRIINQAHIIEKMTYEMGFFVLISFFLVVLTLLLVFRSFWSVITPVIIVLLTAVWTVGVMSVFGKQIDVLSSLIPSISVYCRYLRCHPHLFQIPG